MSKSTRYPVPLSSDDLRQVAKLMDKTERILYNVKTGEFKADVLEYATTGLWTIPVLRPGLHWNGDEADVIGHLIPEDGWLGFIPLGEIDE